MRSCGSRVAPVLALVLAACGPATADTDTVSTSTLPVGSLPGTVATTSPAQTTTSTESPDQLADQLAACVSSWPLRDRIALLVWPSVYSEQWATAQAVVGDLHVGGVILMKPGDDFAADLATHLAELDAVSPHGMVVATDEEGGAVQRLSALEVIPSQEAMSGQDPAAITAMIEQHARLIAAAGIDVVLGPVVDVRPAEGEDPLGAGRLFVGDPEEVSALGLLYVEAWQSAGLLPVLKHFPGHGAASADTHQELATTPPLAELSNWDLVPYRQLAATGSGVMMGHLAVPGLTDGEPASLHARAVALLRNELGYSDALVMTDALGMGAVGLSVPSAAVKALQAGVDVVIFTSTGETADVIHAIEAAVDAGTLTVAEIDDSAVRVARLIEERGTPCAPAA